MLHTIIGTMIAAVVGIVLNLGPSMDEAMAKPVSLLGYAASAVVLAVWLRFAIKAGQNGYRSFLVYAAIYWVFCIACWYTTNLSIATGIDLTAIAFLGLILLFVPFYGVVYQCVHTLKIDYVYGFIVLFLVIIGAFFVAYRSFASQSVFSAEEDEENTPE